MGAKKDVEFRYGLMAPVMKEIGKMTKPMVKVPLCMLMEMSIVVSGITKKQMGWSEVTLSGSHRLQGSPTRFPT